MIVGTAGHIDHGKTSLVAALTGVDTDRLKEEKARGITIELGFAYLPRPDGGTIGFIDVPGHERLVHTMLAGATGIDFVLLAIAADDGVMPQTREHLAIIQLLGSSQGMVALSKCDLVSTARIAEVVADVRALLDATPLAQAPIVPASSVTREGVAEVLAHLDDAARHIARRATDGRFRLAVDRVFTVPGSGTVVTGTALSGAVAIGDHIIVSPSGLEARVRSIHAQNQRAETGQAGQRCALVLTGAKISVDTIARGDIVLEPTLHAPTKRIDARVRLLTSEKKPIGAWMPVKVHHASAEFDARILALEDKGIGPGGEGFAQIVLDRPAALAAGDRIVLRDTSATHTMGGGTILDLHPPERHRRSEPRRRELDILTRPDALDALRLMLHSDRALVDIDAWFRDRAKAAFLADDAIRSLELVALGRPGARHAMLPATWQRYLSRGGTLLASYHEANPDLPGMGQERFRNEMSPRLPAPAFSDALARMQREGVVTLDRSWVRLPSHVVRLSDADERTWARIKPLLGGIAQFRPPRVRDIAKTQHVDEASIRRILKLAARRGDLDEIAQDHFFLAETVAEMADVARHLSHTNPSGEFSVIDFRDRLHNGRKVAIQILEFFDRQGLTMRRGDIRRINPHKSQLFSRPAPVSATALVVGGASPPVGRPDFKSGEGRETALGGFDSCLLRQPSHGARR